MEVWLVVGGVALYCLYRLSKKGSTKMKFLDRKTKGNAQSIGGQDEDVVLSEVTPNAFESGPGFVKQVVEIVTGAGVPAFKYRFQANLEFSTSSAVLKKHDLEDFIERRNGNHDVIQEEGGWWAPVSEWERPGIDDEYENKRFKYIGGVDVYIQFLLSLRAVYEDKSKTPESKRDALKKICESNHDVYTVRYVYIPPWELLIVPVLSLAEGFGPHRVGLLEAAGIRSISDVESRSDRELLEIKGIGKAAVAGLRNLAASWRYDKFTTCIERDEQYR